jgi:hypothetical protein
MEFAMGRTEITRRHYLREGSRYASDMTDGERTLMAAFMPDALAELGRWTIQVTRRCDTARDLHVLPRRWVFERAFLWLNRCRRLAKEFAASVESAVAWAFVADNCLLARHLARP